jgi:hypothetical protein
MRACSVGQLVPHRVKALEGFQDVVLADLGILLPCSAPGSHHDLRRADQRPRLLDHRRLDLTGCSATIWGSWPVLVIRPRI